jgi:Sec-independent protein translocase protein TatA
MNIFGIGPLEVVFILIIGILVLGPEGMIEAGRKFGKFLRSVLNSSWWKNVRQGINDIQHLPQRLMREAELEELNELRKLTRKGFPSIASDDLLKSSTWSSGPSNDPQPTQNEESKKDTPPDESDQT